MVKQDLISLWIADANNTSSTSEADGIHWQAKQQL